jgi:hypothetical protein
VRTETSPQSKASEAHHDNLPQSPRNRENHPNRFCSGILACEIAPGEDFSVGSMSQVPPKTEGGTKRRAPASAAYGSGKEASRLFLRPAPYTSRCQPRVATMLFHASPDGGKMNQKGGPDTDSLR